ncbi:SIS domain-containing protein [Leptospira yasudae]|uniref:SIS domain-containing protein n=1 Tax=Leptospira yasudae TaxID=2202201 RepID=UPI001C501B11|nr:SIS domain-containing protein [Leptospira yasudae]MBW0434123.1 SIS domain-containing protein [Leptospira yasudae]
MSAYDKALNFSKTFQAEILESVQKLDLEAISRIGVLLFEAKENGNNIFFFGNGGSHGIASHLACDFGKGTKITNLKGQKYYRVFGLDNAAWLTAQANDGKEPFVDGQYPGKYTHGYDGVFVGQMENFIQPGDIAFGISSSGNSQNVINALLFAKSKGCKTVAMVGFDGGEALKIADEVLFVPTQKGKYGVVEGVHEVIHHLLYEFAILLEKDK